MTLSGEKNLRNDSASSQEEMSMDEVLASIRKIIASDEEDISSSEPSFSDSRQRQETPPLSSTLSQPEEDDLIELTEEIGPNGEIINHETPQSSKPKEEKETKETPSDVDAFLNTLEEDSEDIRENLETPTASSSSAQPTITSDEELSSLETQNSQEAMTTSEETTEERVDQDESLNAQDSATEAQKESSGLLSKKETSEFLSEESPNDQNEEKEPLTQQGNKDSSAISSDRLKSSPIEQSTPHTNTEETMTQSDNSFLSTTAKTATLSALSELKAQINQESHPATPQEDEMSLKSLALQAMTPLLKEWLDKNLPHLVEKVVQEEIRKLVGKS